MREAFYLKYMSVPALSSVKTSEPNKVPAFRVVYAPEK